jgi:uncharacterized membrane protein
LCVRACARADSDSYQHYLGLVVFLIIAVVIGMPVAVAFALWRNRVRSSRLCLLFALAHLLVQSV